MQMLLYPFEEKFHVPSLSIEFCDGKSIVSQTVGDETVEISRGKVFIDYHAKFLWVLLLGVFLSKSDNLITDNTCMLINRHGLDNLILHVVLSQSIARDGIANTAVIELMGNSQRIQACLYIAQTILISILSQAHNQRLVITGEVSHPVIASVLGNNIIEFPTRYELHNLCEYDLSEIYVTRFFDKDCKVSQFKSCTRNIESKSFYFNNLYLNRLVLTGH